MNMRNRLITNWSMPPTHAAFVIPAEAGIHCDVGFDANFLPPLGGGPSGWG
jgi:hypothetical protein